MRKIKINKETVVFVILCLFIAIEVFFFLPAVFKHIVDINKKISSIKNNITSINKEWPLKNTFEQKIKQLDEEISVLKTKYITAQQTPTLLSFISSESKNFGIEIEQIKPQNLVKKSSLKIGVFNYFPISISLKASFHNLAAFLDYLQNSNYFFEITDIDIVSNAPLHSVNIRICGLVKE